MRSILDARTNRRGRSRASLLLTSALMIGMLPTAAVRLTARTAPAEASHDAITTVISSARGVRPVVEVTANRTAVATEDHQNRSDASPAMPLEIEPVPALPQGTQQLQPTRYEALRLLFTDADWRAEMFALLVARARAHLHDAMVMVEIGTAAPMDIAPLQRMLDDLGEAAAADSKQPSTASAADMATVRQRFAAAIRNLDAADRRFAVGLATVGELNDAMRAALDALREPPIPVAAPNYIIGPGDVLVVTVWRQPDVSGEVIVRSDGKIALPVGQDIVASGLTVEQLKLKVTEELKKFHDNPTVFIQVKQINSRKVSIAGAPMSDADLIAAIRSAATIVSDTARADTLLALSGRYALSSQMVALYVAVANGIESESERARVFAQPIRIKGGR